MAHAHCDGREGSLRLNFAELSNLLRLFCFNHLETTNVGISGNIPSKSATQKMSIKTCMILVMDILRFYYSIIGTSDHFPTLARFNVIQFVSVWFEINDIMKRLVRNVSFTIL